MTTYGAIGVPASLLELFDLPVDFFNAQGHPRWIAYSMICERYLGVIQVDGSSLDAGPQNLDIEPAKPLGV